MKEINKNNVKISGKLNDQIILSHETHEIKMYTTTIDVARKSGVIDKLPITIPDTLLSKLNQVQINTVTITGEIRTYNKQKEDNKNKLLVNVFVKDIVINDNELYENEVELEGYICKEPVYRETPLNRKICDLLIAVNRGHSKSNYIPVICWGKTADISKDLLVGTKVNINGRLQSRNYDKNGETKTTYELSVTSIEEINSLPDDFEPLEEIEL